MRFMERPSAKVRAASYRGTCFALAYSCGVQVLQVDEALRRRQRRLQLAGFGHERDDLGEAARVDFRLARQDLPLGLEIKRERALRDERRYAGGFHDRLHH